MAQEIALGYSLRRRSCPSWVPDLSEQRESKPYASIFSYQEEPTAGGKCLPNISLGPGPSTLEIHGVLWGAITALTEPFLLPKDPNNSLVDVARCKYKFGNQVLALLDRLHSPRPDYIEHLALRALVGGNGSKEEAEHILQEDETGSFQRPLRLWVDFQTRIMQHRGHNLRYYVLNPNGPDVEEDLLFLRQGHYLEIDRLMQEFSYGKAFVVMSSSGEGNESFCVVPPLARAGDIVMIPVGSPTPFIIRKKEGRIVRIGRKVFS